eukprot:g32143.t1
MAMALQHHDLDLLQRILKELEQKEVNEGSRQEIAQPAKTISRGNSGHQADAETQYSSSPWSTTTSPCSSLPPAEVRDHRTVRVPLQLESALRIRPPPGLPEPLTEASASEPSSTEPPAEPLELGGFQWTITTLDSELVSSKRGDRWFGFRNPNAKFKGSCGCALVSPPFSAGGLEGLRVIFSPGETPRFGSLQLKFGDQPTVQEVTLFFQVADTRQLGPFTACSEHCTSQDGGAMGVGAMGTYEQSNLNFSPPFRIAPDLIAVALSTSERPSTLGALRCLARREGGTGWCASGLDGPCVLQSGSPDIYWNSGRESWAVHFPRGGVRTCKMFSTNPLMRQGLSRSEAESTALERAKEFRQELLKQGILKEPVTKDEPQSPVVGVEAELKAQEMWRHAVPHATEDPALSADAAADERPQRSYPGVCWIRRDRCWWASVSVQKVRKHFSLSEDGSEEELNRSFQEVVAWLEHQKATRETRDEAPRPRKCPRPERPVFFADGGDEEPQKKTLGEETQRDQRGALDMRPRGGRCVGLPHFQPKEPHPGVCWMPSEQCWKAEFRKNGLRVKTRSKPKDHSEEELERSFQERGITTGLTLQWFRGGRLYFALCICSAIRRLYAG